MQTALRRRYASVVQRLLDEPHRFELVQTVRVLALWFRQSGLPPEAWPRLVRYRNSLSMSFPASQVEALVAAAEDDGAAGLKEVSITPAYMGFLGVHGTMPYRFTEDIAAQVLHAKYEGGRAFFDIFLNRMMTLHFRAWEKYRIRCRLDASARDVLLPMQLALAGGGDNTAVPDGEELVAHFAALLRQRPVSARTIGSVLSEYLRAPVVLEQFMGQWDALGETEIARLGKQNTTLGKGFTLGTRCWERHSRIRIHVGPLSRSEFDEFIPGGAANRALRHVLALFSTPALEFDLNLILRTEDVRSVTLGTPVGARLGMGACLMTKPAEWPRSQLFALPTP